MSPGREMPGKLVTPARLWVVVGSASIKRRDHDFGSWLQNWQPARERQPERKKFLTTQQDVKGPTSRVCRSQALHADTGAEHVREVQRNIAGIGRGREGCPPELTAERGCQSAVDSPHRMPHLRCMLVIWQVQGRYPCPQNGFFPGSLQPWDTLDTPDPRKHLGSEIAAKDDMLAVMLPRV